MQLIRTTLIAVLLVVASAQAPSPPSAASAVAPAPSSSPSPATLTPASASSVTASSTSSATPTAAPEEKNDEGSYYRSIPGKSYDDDPNAAIDETMTGGNDGDSKAFMGMSMPAQIGIICAIVICAIGMFACVVAYYFWRRRQWEKNVERRSMLLTQKAAAQKLAQATISANSSKESLSEKDLEKGETVKSEFESESRKTSAAPVWKRWLIQK